VRLAVVLGPGKAPPTGLLARWRRIDLDPAPVVELDNAALAPQPDASPIGCHRRQAGGRGDRNTRLADRYLSEDARESERSQVLIEREAGQQERTTVPARTKVAIVSSGVGVVTVEPAAWKPPV
jgi:hypothetical protein